MENHDELLERLLRELDKKERIYDKKDDGYIAPWIRKKEDRPYDRGIDSEDIMKKIVKESTNITIKDVLKKFKPEELVEAIGIEKVESILRAHKIKKLKKQIKK